VTDTDVAQSEAQLAAAEATMHGAESTLTTTRANYRRIIGVDPGNLSPASSVERMAPPTLTAAIAAGAAENPSVIAALYGIDVAQLQVKIAEGALFPTLAAQYNVQYGVFPQLLTPHQFTDTVMLNLSVPIYQGGAEYSAIRLNKESLSQQRLNIDDVRDQTRAPTSFSSGASCKLRRRRSKPPSARTMRPSAHSPVCATRRWPASVPPRMCSSPNRPWSMPARV
jgi:outer membrane protein